MAFHYKVTNVAGYANTCHLMSREISAVALDKLRLLEIIFWRVTDIFQQSTLSRTSLRAT